MSSTAFLAAFFVVVLATVGLAAASAEVLPLPAAQVFAEETEFVPAVVRELESAPPKLTCERTGNVVDLIKSLLWAKKGNFSALNRT